MESPNNPEKMSVCELGERVNFKDTFLVFLEGRRRDFVAVRAEEAEKSSPPYGPCAGGLGKRGLGSLS